MPTIPTVVLVEVEEWVADPAANHGVPGDESATNDLYFVAGRRHRRPDPSCGW